MKNLIKIIALVITAFLFQNPGYCQTTFNYDYDASGNRYLRNVLVLKSGIIDTTNNNVAPGNNEAIKKNAIKNDVIGNVTLTLYPNPTTGSIEIVIDNFDNESTGEILVFDIKGTLLFRQEQIAQKSTIDFYDRSTGTYIVKILLNGEVSEWKVIKE